MSNIDTSLIELNDNDLALVSGGTTVVPPDVVLSLNIEQVLNIGSQSSGAGAGKVTFNPFSIRR